jgi:hypothetical protein
VNESLHGEPAWRQTLTLAAQLAKAENGCSLLGNIPRHIAQQ